MRKIKRITCVINNISSTGGAERVMTVLCNKFVEMGIESTIIVRQSTKSSYPLDKRVRVISTTVNDISNKYIRNIKRNFMLRNEIKKSNPDVIISFMTGMNIQVLLYTIGLKIPIIISERNNPATDISKRDMPLVKLLYPRAAGYVFQTDDARNWFSKSIASVGIVIANPISDKLPIRESITQGKIVNEGRLSAQKNQRMLIDAFEKFSKIYPEYKLFIYGDGPEENNLKKYIKENKLEKNIILMGYASDVMEQIKDAECFVLSSDYEGMPNALMEAMGIGIPCISTDCPCGGPRYLIDNMENGILTDVGNSQQLVDAMISIANNKILANSLGKKATEVNKKLDANVIAKQWIAYCEQIMENKII